METSNKTDGRGHSLPDKNILRKEYDEHAAYCSFATKDLELFIEEAVSSLPSHPTVKGRVKAFESFYRKYIKLLKTGPLKSGIPVITDLIGVRIICPFIEDLDSVEELLKRTFAVTELEHKGSGFSFKEFGYESTHLLIRIPPQIIRKYPGLNCEIAEIQIRTILQDAWAEVEHELVYKAEFTPFDDPMKRKLAALNATLSLADTIFQEIRTYQRKLAGELGKRRESLFKKIEESNDSFLFDNEIEGKNVQLAAQYVIQPNESIDDLLLNALYAHNQGRFNEAIDFYSRILSLKPDTTITALIYKHRGMANFAQSKYKDAIDDFTHVLELDDKAYKAAYYRGVVKSVLEQYSGAIDDFTLSLEINPYQAFCLFRRGQAYFHIEDYPQALSDCEASLTLDPANEAAIKFRVLLLDKLKM